MLLVLGMPRRSQHALGCPAECQGNNYRYIHKCRTMMQNSIQVDKWFDISILTGCMKSSESLIRFFYSQPNHKYIMA